MNRNEIIRRNENALKALRRARQEWKSNRNLDVRKALKIALIEWVNAHADFTALK